MSLVRLIIASGLASLLSMPPAIAATYNGDDDSTAPSSVTSPTAITRGSGTLSTFGESSTREGVAVTYIGQGVWIEDSNRPAANWTTVKYACDFAAHWRLPAWDELAAARLYVKNPVNVDMYTHTNIDQYYIRGYNLTTGVNGAIYYTAARPYRCAYVE